MSSPPISRRSMLWVLHPAMALTGVAESITGPLLPALARAFHLSDTHSGFLVFCAFAGMASGALLCRGDYARLLTRGFLAMMLASALFPWISRPVLFPYVFLFGVSVGVPMSAVSLFAGRNYTQHRAATLTVLNFSWSLGALLAPLLAGRLLAVATWQAVYLVLAGAAAILALAAGLLVRDTPEAARITPETTGLRNLRLVTLFAAFFFLEVGMESTFGAWLSTYMLRASGIGIAQAAAAAAIFWSGFLVSRGFSPLLLLRIRPGSLLRVALPAALAGSILLLATQSFLLTAAAILLLGASLAPIFPVALSAFFDRARHTSDSRYILAFSGFGGSLFPWLVGFISSRSGSLRTSLLVGPVVLLFMTLMLPWLRMTQPAPSLVTAPTKAAENLP
ncbi:MAG TPA: MFS transporter [Terracidiphilus sp.]|nr:MFS transporter [Terracidiphilus sp.]